ncbi:MAG: hypothetical protein R3B82_07570 [Sandaracinaceae bacterium]
MGWKGAIRSISAEIRRQERAAARRAREAERQWKAQQKAAASEAARYEVAAYEAYIETLTSIHRESSDPIDWEAIRARPEPVMPAEPVPVDTSRSAAARAELDGFEPGFFERLFGLKGRRTRLENALEEQLAAEEQLRHQQASAHLAAVEAWKTARDQWSDLGELADRILGGDVEAYGDVIRAAGCFDELGGVIGNQSMEIDFADGKAEVRVAVLEDSVVPTEQKSLTKGGKVSLKKLPATRKLELYQDYVCGAALRIARELFAVTRVSGVLVHVSGALLNTSNGHFEQTTILSVYCPREKLESVGWEQVDASDLIGSLMHAMKVRRGKGFGAVAHFEMPG